MITLPTFEMGNHIPTLIHQTYPDKAGLTAELRENIQKISKMNRKWDYCIYFDSDIEHFILSYYSPQILKVYQSINPDYGAARADFFRYLLMYAKGGVYLDIKSSVTRPFDELIALDDRFILSHWEEISSGFHPELKSNSGSEYQQWHIITVKGHPFLRRVIERVIQNIQQYNIFKIGVGKIGVLRLTGPIPYTLAIEELKNDCSFRKVDICKDFGMVYNICSGLNTMKNHRKLFKKHYSKLKTPIIMQGHFKSYVLMGLFYLSLIINFPLAKIFKLVFGSRRTQALRTNYFLMTFISGSFFIVLLSTLLAF